jgi:hypothetical protein
MASSDSWVFMVIARNFSSALEFKPRSEVLQTTIDLNAGMSNNTYMMTVLVAYCIVLSLLSSFTSPQAKKVIPVFCTSTVFYLYSLKCDWACQYDLNLKRMSYDSPYRTLVVSYVATSFLHDEYFASYVRMCIFHTLLKFYVNIFRLYKLKRESISLHVDMLYKMICSISSTCTCIIFLIPTITVSESDGLNVSELFAYRLKQAMVFFFVLANGRIVFKNCNVFTFLLASSEIRGLCKILYQMCKCSMW